MMHPSPWQRHPLVLIVFAQLCGTSLWFSVNGVSLASSLLALLGGSLIFALGDGPYLPAPVARLRLSDGLAALGKRRFRAVAGGYFGHCWELYACWVLTPFLVARELERLAAPPALLPWLSFGVIALGLFGCVGGGMASRRRGSLWVARGH